MTYTAHEACDLNHTRDKTLQQIETTHEETLKHTLKRKQQEDYISIIFSFFFVVYLRVFLLVITLCIIFFQPNIAYVNFFSAVLSHYILKIKIKN